jgi:hypothetical protein
VTSAVAVQARELSFFDFLAHISWVSGTGLGQNFDANPFSIIATFRNSCQRNGLYCIGVGVGQYPPKAYLCLARYTNQEFEMKGYRSS